MGDVTIDGVISNATERKKVVEALHLLTEVWPLSPAQEQVVGRIILDAMRAEFEQGSDLDSIAPPWVYLADRFIGNGEFLSKR